MIKITVWALPHTKWRHCMEIITQNEKILYIGIDVHKNTYSLWSFDFHKNELSDEITIKATTKAVIKYLEAIRKKHKEEILFACVYEAGPAGTTNAIESLNSTYRKLNRQRSVFPSDYRDWTESTVKCALCTKSVCQTNPHKKDKLLFTGSCI